MTVLPAQIDDARAIAETHVRSWQQAYRGLLPDKYLASLSIDQREEFWLDVLASNSSKVLIAVKNGIVVGFLSFRESRDSENKSLISAEILAFYVEPKQWRKGIGKTLWSECRNDLAMAGYQTVTLWVIANNASGIGFYEAMGFEREEGAIEQSKLGGVSFLEQRYIYSIYENHETTNS
ncbi:MAG: GNAT family N-acetyltransferase [Methyloglobulus sp.]|nr:GNAT family N-acetyltransferase [Methyloglobulus sp.]